MRVVKAVEPQPGRPLYLTVRDTIREAIDAGAFPPGQRMPSTKNLSEQLKVSLVTTHRALKELVAIGVLHRHQGRGTFVRHRYRNSGLIRRARFGLIVTLGASLTNYFHAHVLEGIRQAAEHSSADLLLLPTSEDLRDECDGFLFLSPSAEQIETFLARDHRKPALIVGAASHWPQIASVDVSSIELARQALTHLRELGHRRIGYVGRYDNLCVGRDQWDGFLLACEQLNLTPLEQHVVRGMSWRLDSREKMALMRFLAGPDRPTAIFASGIELALDVYHAAAEANLCIPRDLSIVGVEDPPSGPHWNPPITTIRKPLSAMACAAVAALLDCIHQPDVAPTSQTLPTELIVRASTSAASL